MLSLLITVMDYALYGQIMDWDSEERRFKPCVKDKEYFSEKDIQKILRDCIRALDFSKKKYLFLVNL